MSHSLFAPSSAERWVHCHGSISLAVIYPDEESDEAREGTAAHWLAIDYDGELSKDVCVGLTAPNGVCIDEDMYYGAVQYHHCLNQSLKGGESIYRERTVPIPRIHEKAFGTPDTDWYDEDSETLYIFDYKYGHKPVDAFGNWQLIMYAAGLLDLYGIWGKNPTIRFEIVQPRAFHSNSGSNVWTVKEVSLRGKFNKLFSAAQNSLTSNARCRSGTHCEHCPARHACPTNRAAVGAALDYTGKVLPDAMKPEELSFELDVLTKAQKMIASRRTALAAEVEALLRKGVTVPMYRMQDAYGNRKWNQSDETIIQVGEMCGVELKAPVKAKSPAQAEKELKEKGVDDSVIKPYITKPMTGKKLIADDGSRLQYLLNQET